MSDTNTQTADNTQNAEVKEPVKLGTLQRFAMPTMQENNSAVTDNEDINTEGANATNANNGAADSTENAAPAPTMPTPEQLKEYFKSLNIDYDGDDKIKEKLTAPATTTAAPTEAEIQAKELAKEKRLLDKFISGKGTAEQYVALKGVANADPNKFALDMAKTDLMKGGLTLEEAEIYVKENLGMIDDTELEQLGDESDRAFKKRQKEFNAKLLAANSNPHIEKAKWVLQNLNEAIEAEDLQVQQEVTLSAKIDEDFKVLPRKLSIEIGKIGTTDVLPVDYDVSEADVAEIKGILKDPTKRQQLLYNQDGSLNITRISQALIKEKAFESAGKVLYHSGMTKAIEDFQKTFPARSAQELGVGGSPNRPNPNQKGQPAAVGKNVRMQPQRQ